MCLNFLGPFRVHVTRGEGTGPQLTNFWVTTPELSCDKSQSQVMLLETKMLRGPKNRRLIICRLIFQSQPKF